MSLTFMKELMEANREELIERLRRIREFVERSSGRSGTIDGLTADELIDGVLNLTDGYRDVT